MVRLLDVRAQIASVFHLDKCIGCHTCSIACKNVWTDRPGAEYMWWNNVETKPGTGYPTQWEDQETYRGGWKLDGKRHLKLLSQSRLGGLTRLFYNPNQPGLDEYYEPWTYRYTDLFDAPAGEDQPTARPVSLLTGEVIDVEAGPNWDDDLSGSPIYAENDPNLAGMSEEDRSEMFKVERIAMMYLPRICNHCVNPSCVAACPSGAIYKRGEDGIVLINQEKCRGWRACISACPYKKTFYNWQAGKSEKCIYCFPRVETGQAPACFHSCVGRIRYAGVLLYDAARMLEAVTAPAASLVEAQRNAIVDPNDPAVIESALRNGVSPQTIAAAQASPVYRFVKLWGLALPLHPEFRTFPMLFYVPPLLPEMGRAVADLYEHGSEALFAPIERARIPIQYLARMLSAGNTDVVERALRKLAAVRIHNRAAQVGDIDSIAAQHALRAAGLSATEADEIYKLTALADERQRYVLPAIAREEAIEGDEEGRAALQKGTAGLGLTVSTPRGG
jgi:nitrate reductase / nitrite oxidoreductase, beta subunit